MHKSRCAPLIGTWLLLHLGSGCVRIPPVQRSAEISPELLRQHVEFLAQPTLGGREPRSGESDTARKYITSRLAAFGLRPWAKTSSLEQPFVIGTNIVAVLPGSDPDMSHQFVFL